MLCCIVNILPSSQANWQVAANSLSSSQLVQQGIERYQVGKYTEAIALWQQALSEISEDTAIVRSNLAQAYRQIGQGSQAIAQT